jgi:hypothetical protein
MSETHARIRVQNKGGTMTALRNNLMVGDGADVGCAGAA